MSMRFRGILDTITRVRGVRGALIEVIRINQDACVEIVRRHHFRMAPQSGECDFARRVELPLGPQQLPQPKKDHAVRVPHELGR